MTGAEHHVPPAASLARQQQQEAQAALRQLDASLTCLPVTCGQRWLLSAVCVPTGVKAGILTNLLGHTWFSSMIFMAYLPAPTK